MLKRSSSSSQADTVWKKFSITKVKNDYKPISDYGLIGDGKTCALVGMDASIDWLCIPRFDSPSIFASVLDVRRGGSFRVLPNNGGDEFEASQFYDGPSSILATELRDSSGRIRITDFMPCFRVAGTMISTNEIHRRISCFQGKFRVEVSVEPRMDYARIVPNVKYLEGLGYSFVSTDPQVRQEIALITHERLQVGEGSVSGVLDLKKGNSVDLVLRGGGVKLHHADEVFTDEKLHETRD
jgi:GH15 family glucan-1,4-alpha-glucosidase